MEIRRIEVCRYYACDGKVFDDADKCLAYEREIRVELDEKIHKRRCEIITLKEQADELRLRFSVAKCDALLALNTGGVRTFHKKMYEYYEGKSVYNVRRATLHSERVLLNRLLDKSYLWFKDRKHKSMYAKKERRQMSLRWRQENTPDKWRTPNKIRVSKQPKEEQ